MNKIWIIICLILCGCTYMHQKSRIIYEDRRFYMLASQIDLRLPVPYRVSQEECDGEGKFIVIGFPDTAYMIITDHPLMSFTPMDGPFDPSALRDTLRSGIDKGKYWCKYMCSNHPRTISLYYGSVHEADTAKYNAVLRSARISNRTIIPADTLSTHNVAKSITRPSHLQ